MNKKNIVDVLKEQGYLLISPIGNSMRPLLRPQCDIVCLKYLFKEPKKFDIVLYQRADGTYVLHRIVDIKNDSYVLCGDNQTNKENGIKQNDILAVVDYFFRGDLKIENHNILYKGYILLWCKCFLFRRFILRVLSKRRTL